MFESVQVNDELGTIEPRWRYRYRSVLRGRPPFRNREIGFLECEVIVLTGIDDVPPEDEKSLLYVGLSRARVYLVVVATSATLARIGLLAP